MNRGQHRPSRERSLRAALAWMGALAGCAESLESPKPSLSALSPALVCNDQLVTEVIVDGKNLTPLPADLVTDHPVLLLPGLAVHQVAELDGTAATSAAIALGDSTRWIDASTMSFEVAPELALPAGVFDLTVTNLDGSRAEASAALASAPPPSVEGIAPNLVCVEQGPVDVVISGAGFLRVGDALPRVKVGDAELDAAAAEDCADLAGPVEGASCLTLAVTLPAEVQPPGVHPVTVVNPETAACVSTEAVDLEIVPAPRLFSFTPDLSCIDQGDRVYDLTGEGFLVLEDGTTPTVEVGTYAAPADSASGCTELAGPAGGRSCTGLRFTLPIDAVEPGLHPVVVRNPPPANSRPRERPRASCTSSEPVEVRLVAQPTLAALTPIDSFTERAVPPALTCLEQGPRRFLVEGSGFVVLEDGTLPTVWVGDAEITPDRVVEDEEPCVDLEGAPGGRLCSQLEITVPEDAEVPGLHDVVVHNPAPADCHSEEPVTLEVFARPTLASIVEPLDCTEQSATTFTLTGTGFLRVDGHLPTVHLGAYAAEASGAGGCVAVPGSGADEVCTELTLDVAADTLETGLQPVNVTNPDSVLCTSEEAVDVEILAPPSVDRLEPPGVCDGASGDVTVTVWGSGFLVVGGVTPIVEIDGLPFTSEISPYATLTPLQGDLAGDLVDALELVLPDGTFPELGDYPVVVHNPPPADCDSTDPVAWSVTLPPIIEGVSPLAICDNAQTIEVTGQNFTPGSIIVIDDPANPDPPVELATTFVSPNLLQGEVPPGIGAGLYDVTVRSGADCEDTVSAILEIVDQPIIFFVDPPTTYTGITIQATVYVSGIHGGVQRAEIESATDGAVTVLCSSDPNDAAPDCRYDPAEPAVVPVTIPAGLDGVYHLRLGDDLGCDPELRDAFEVVSTPTLRVDRLEPPFGWTAAPTPVEILGTSPPGFANVPRVYLSPVDTGLGSELRAVTFQDQESLDAVVPEGLEVGAYDVIVVNPDGQIGVLLGGYEVVAERPPVIFGVTPPTFDSQIDHPAEIGGEGFANPAVDLECVDPISGVPFVATAVVDGWTDLVIDVTLPTKSDPELAGGAVCVVVVTNQDQGTWARFSAISVTNPADNLYPWRDATDLTRPRVGLAGAAGRATRTSRFVYAIGGSDGGGTTYDTVERARIDQFGALGPWDELPTTLPAASSHAGVATLGRFVYLVGGHDGTGPVDTVWRARILDPLQAPAFLPELAVRLDPVDGLDPASYVYRVSATFPAGFDDDPGGESLPSDPFVVRVPDVSPDRVQLTLAWTPVPDAVGYRVYRSATGSGNETLYAVLGPVTSFTDDGTGDTASPETPLPSGALGRWRQLASLPYPAQSPCVTVAADPASSTRAWVYAAGGHDGATFHDEILKLGVDLVDEHDQDSLGAWEPTNAALDTPRWQCGAYQVTSELHPDIPPGDTWLYFGAGQGQGMMTSTIAARVAAGGDFDVVELLANDMKRRAGYVTAAASSYLYCLGGQNAGPDNQGESAFILDPPPQVGGWTSLGGGKLLHPRYLAGSAQESSVIFAIGGEGGPRDEPATTSVEFTNY